MKTFFLNVNAPEQLEIIDVYLNRQIGDVILERQSVQADANPTSEFVGMLGGHQYSYGIVLANEKEKESRSLDSLDKAFADLYGDQFAIAFADDLLLQRYAKHAIVIHHKNKEKRPIAIIESSYFIADFTFNERMFDSSKEGVESITWEMVIPQLVNRVGTEEQMCFIRLIIRQWDSNGLKEFAYGKLTSLLVETDEIPQDAGGYRDPQTKSFGFTTGPR